MNLLDSAAADAGEPSEKMDDEQSRGSVEREVKEVGHEDVDNDDGGKEAGEDDDDDDEDEEYQLCFDGEVDPLDLAKEDANGLELYRQLERLEYEALSERKRKPLPDLPSREEPSKKQRQDEYSVVSMEDIDAVMASLGSRRRRRSRAPKKRGRKKGSKNKVNPEISRKVGSATLLYGSGHYSEAICLLEEAVRLAPNYPDSYYVLGLIYDAMGNRKKAMDFHMIEAHLKPKDSSIWKKLIAWSIEQGNTGQVRYCLSKAITADPNDVGLRFDRASLYSKLKEYQKAAESYDQILGMNPKNIEARIMAAKMYQKCGQFERAISVLEDHVNNHTSEANISVASLLIDLLVEANEHSKALQQIEHAQSIYVSKNKFQLYLTAKAAICHGHLGSIEDAEVLLKDVQTKHAKDNADLITEVADSFANLGHYASAQKLYFLLKEIPGHENGSLCLKIAECYVSMKERGKAIPFFYEALSTMENNIDARITLSFLLVEEGKGDDAIVLLSPPKDSEPVSDSNSTLSKPWWLNGKVQVQLAKIYLAKGMLDAFADAIFSSIRETLVVASLSRKLKVKKKRNLSKSVLFERVKLLDEHTDNVFHGFRPIATTSDLLKASRAKKALQKKEALREEKKAAAIAAGLDWQSEDSGDDAAVDSILRREIGEPPLPGLLNDEGHHQLILDLCKVLMSLQRYWEAFEIIYHTLRVAQNKMSDEKKEELRRMGAYIAYKTKDPKHGFYYARYIVEQHPQSVAAWNCYYKFISRFESPQPLKFLRRMRVRHEDVVPPMVIHGHQFTLHSQHQAAAEEYLEAYKLQPENPLINLCVGTALVNLALGFRLQNKHQCVAQGFAFLYKYLRICRSSQEALYNVARAHHHVGLLTLAAAYYEKVLAVKEEDYPIPKLPVEDQVFPEKLKPGYCDLRREAAYNLHLIYKKSRAVDLARQVLKDYCNP